MVAETTTASGSDPLKEMLWAARGAFATAAVFSFFVNLLILVMPVYMFSLFDRVLGGGGNEITLAFLAIFAMGALLIQAVIDMARTYLFVQVSSWIDRQIGAKIFALTLRHATVRGSRRDIELLGRMDALRNFLAGEQVFMLMDLPWLPLFLAFLFFLQFWIGAAAATIAVIILLLALANKWITDPVREVGMEAMQNSTRNAEISLRNADVIESMGMGPQVRRRWATDNDVALDRFSVFTRRMGLMAAIGKTMQFGSMMAIMTVCAILIINPETNLSRGAMMASVILVGRVLMPVQFLVTGWGPISEALKNYQALSEALREAVSFAPKDQSHDVPVKPTGNLTVENLSFHPPTASKPVLSDISFALKPGQSLGIVGPSASGKSSLARLLVGLDRPTEGSVKLDGQDIHEWPADDLGTHLGYLPQDVELFGGTVRDNIARHDRKASRDKILDAARLANVDTMVKFMPRGYQTRIGAGGTLLSGGQQQRVGLARALFGDVKIVVLDEPNANLDAHGEQALAEAVEELKRRGVTVVLILHRPNILKVLDYVMIMVDGKIQKYGPKNEMLPLITGTAAAKQPDDRAINVVTHQAEA
jgi:PrtD family type I secretion system ABC transporter